MRPIFFTLFFLLAFSAIGQNLEFIENKGQWDREVLYRGQAGNAAFYIHGTGFTVLQHDPRDWNRLHEISHDKSLDGKPIPDAFSLVLHSHAYRTRFVGANEKARMVPDKPLEYYTNYFIGNDPARWATHCNVYQGITVRDIYPNIDLRYYTDKGLLKYDFIVRPGGRVEDIAIGYEGADRLEVKKGELLVHTSLGPFRELAPYTYQFNEKGKVTVDAGYQVSGKTVRFKVGDYDPRSTLVIDPTLMYAGFSGSTADNWGFTATYGPDKSVFGGGIVFSGGFPLAAPAPGPIQTTYSGGGSNCFGTGFDIGLQKLSPDGSTRIFSTYLGGSGNEMPQSLIVDESGNLIIGGRTNSPKSPSPGAFPQTAPTDGAGGSWDIIVTKINATGTAIIGSRRLGGTGDDGANITPCGGGASSLQQNYGDESRSEVNLDAAGNIYLASCTQSTVLNNTNDLFPVTPNAFQTTPGGGQDGVVLKFSPDLSTLLFSSFLGGSGQDAAYVLAIHPTTGNIYVAGGTASNNFPGPKTGVVSPNSNGNIDGFVSIIDPNGTAILKTTYLGTSAIDQVYGIQMDRLGFPYVMGQTGGNWPILNAAYGKADTRQFIAKLQPDLSAFVYSTSFGRPASPFPNISPVAFLVDRCQNVYVSGWGGSIAPGYNNSGVQGMDVTGDAMKPNADFNTQTGTGQDFYFLVLKKDATSLLYGSFFGQNGSAPEHVDGGTSRFDQSGAIYQGICSCGNTNGMPYTPNAAATAKPAGVNCNLYIVKMAFDYAGVGSGVQSSIMGVPRDTAGCVPLTVDFKDTLLQAVTYEWNFGDGPAWTTTTSSTNSHTYLNVGTYRVTLVAVDSSTCNIRDTSYLFIKVGASKALPDFTPKKVGPCQQFQYEFTNNTVAPPGFPFGGQSFIWDFGDNTPRVTTGAGVQAHSYAAPGTYVVKLILNDTLYCNSPDSITKTIRVASLVKADFETPKNGCAPYTAQFNNTSAGGTKFTWDFGDGSAPSNATNPTHLYTVPNTYTITLTAVDSATCNITDTKTFTITVHKKPKALFSASPQPPVVNMPITFTNSSLDATKFKWLFGDGDSLLTTKMDPIQHEFNTTRTYTTCLQASNDAGCADTLCLPVVVTVESAVDVPNAFTPLSGDANSKVFVRGFGFAKINFAVWARWGEKVFETADKRIGWDGRYKGNVLPMDVYTYTLDIEFTDGTKVRKTGDITLIR